MYIIQVEPNPSGSRPGLQEWRNNTIPQGYAICPEKFYDIFYSTNPAGFVNISTIKDTVVEMTVNQEALDNYIANLPEPEPTPEPQASDTEVLNALLGIETEETNG